MHFTMEHVIQAVTGALTIGVAWGVMRASVAGIEKRLEQHMAATSEWRTSLDARVQSITDALIGKR